MLNEGKTAKADNIDDDDDWDAEEITVQGKNATRQISGHGSSMISGAIQKPMSDTMGKPVNTTGFGGSNMQ